MASIASHRVSPDRPIAPKSNYVNLKLCIRLLPPNLNEEQFNEQLSKYTKKDQNGLIVDKYYVKGHQPREPYERPICSRAYLLFKNQNSLDQFKKELVNRPFIEPETNDSMVPTIEKALYNKMPPNAKKKDMKGVSKKLEDDDIYKEFLSFMDNKVDDFSILKINRKLKKKKRERKKKDKKATESKNESKKENKLSKKPKNTTTAEANQESLIEEKKPKSKRPRRKKKATKDEKINKDSKTTKLPEQQKGKPNNKQDAPEKDKLDKEKSTEKSKSKPRPKKKAKPKDKLGDQELNIESNTKSSKSESMKAQRNNANTQERQEKQEKPKKPKGGSNSNKAKPKVQIKAKKDSDDSNVQS